MKAIAEYIFSTKTETLSLINKVEQIREIDREIKKKAKEFEALKKQIIVEMGDRKEVVNQAGHVLLELVPIKSRELFDSKKFKGDFPDIYSEYVSLSRPSTRFELKK